MTGQAGKTCPTCSRPSQERWRPFCSRRCADLDLFRWLNGSYRIPSVPSSEEGDGIEELDGDEES